MSLRKFKKPTNLDDNKNMSLLEAVQMASMFTDNGCRVVQDGAQTVIVYDCCKWEKENTTLLMFLKPNAEVSIHSSVNSLSGFKIIVSEPKINSFCLRFYFSVFILLLFSFVSLFISYEWIHDTFLKPNYLGAQK
jgi:hypothetical protein